MQVVQVPWYRPLKVPNYIRDNKNVTLHLEIEKVTLEGDIFRFAKVRIQKNMKISKMTKTPPNLDKLYMSHFKRSLVDDAMNKLPIIEDMPGFKIKWFYTGLKEESYAIFAMYDDTDSITKAFVRQISIIIIYFLISAM